MRPDEPLNDRDDLDALMRSLDDVASEEAAVADEAARIVGAPGDDRVDAVLAEAMTASDREGASRSRSSMRKLAALLAASALVGVFLWQAVDSWRTDDRPGGGSGPGPGPGNVLLDVGGFELLHPTGPAASYDRIEWRYPQASGRSFALRVTAGARVLIDESGLTKTVRILSDEETAPWPNEIEIVVLAYDDSGSFLGSVHRSAARGPD